MIGTVLKHVMDERGSIELYMQSNLNCGEMKSGSRYIKSLGCDSMVQKILCFLLLNVLFLYSVKKWNLVKGGINMKH